jgi:hypothetical protein
MVSQIEGRATAFTDVTLTVRKANASPFRSKGNSAGILVTLSRLTGLIAVPGMGIEPQAIAVIRN